MGLTETFVDEDEGWVALDRGATEIAIGEGEPDAGEEGAVATIDVDDVKAERERLAQAQVEVGTVLELHGTMRLLDVYDPDGRPAGRAVHARHAAPCLLLAREQRLRIGRAAGAALRRALGTARRHGADRDPGLPAGRRGLVPALQGGQPRLRLRGRTDARALDRDRPEQARHRTWLRSARSEER